jgi:hypothetical protein
MRGWSRPARPSGRWGVETFYGVLKGRLELEHFSGQSVEAVRQDFGAGGAAALSPTPAPVVVPVAPLLAL